MIFTVIITGLRKVFIHISHLQIVEAVIGFLQDPHPRVRYAACNAIGQMATDFAPVFQKKFHEGVVPGLLHVMDDGVNPRVQVCIWIYWVVAELFAYFFPIPLMTDYTACHLH